MLVPVTTAFLIGLFFGSHFPSLPLLCASFLFVAAVTLTWLERDGRISTGLGLRLFGSLLAGLLYWTAYGWFAAPVPFDRQAEAAPMPLAGRIVSPVHYAPGRASFHLALDQPGRTSDNGGRGPILRVTWRDPHRDIRQGDVVTLTASPHPPSGPVNPGGFDYAAYLLEHGVSATASVSGPGAVTWLGATSGLTQWRLWHTIDEWRDLVRHAATASLTGPALGLYLGMVIGQPGYLAQDIRDAFMATGTIHILSISGSHLGLVGLLSFFLIKQGCRRLPARWLLQLSRHSTATRIAALGTVLPVTGYALLAGAEVATVRSWIMILLFLLAVWLGRQEQLLLSLACAALLITLHDPRAIYDISFQLSFCSVLAIALAVRRQPEAGPTGIPPPDRIQKRLADWLATYGRITGWITLMTLPLVAYHFNQIAWLGLVANLVVVPFAGLLLVPLGLGSALWTILTGSPTLPGAALNQAGYEYLSDFIQGLARLPGAEYHVASPSLLLIGCFYGLLAMAIGLRTHRGVRVTCLLGAMLLVGWWVWSLRLWAQDGSLRVTFLDVGQGDAAVLELPEGETVLIDAGARYDTLDMGRSVVSPYLWDRGIVRLDHVIATHPQLDHVGGLPAVLKRFSVGRYWSNGVPRPEPFYRDLRQALERQGLVESVAAEGHTLLSTASCRLSALNPRASDQAGPPPAALAGAAMNNQSVIVKLVCGPHSFLFSADAETATLARLAGLEASAGIRVLKVPHHGASSSLEAGWIGHVAPEIAVISVGRRNPYGHPTSAVLQAYERQGSRLFRTDRDGAVSITARLSSSTLDLSLARAARPRPVRAGSFLLRDEYRNWKRLHRLATLR